MGQLKPLAVIAFLGISTAAWAQSPPVTPVAEATPAMAVVAPPAAPAATIRIPAGTPIMVEITDVLSSETSQQQQLFGLRLAEPIVIDGREVVPAGAIGGGEVIDAHPSAFGGRQGRLIVSGRFIEIAGQRARIRAMQMTGAGEDRAGAAIAVGVAVGIPAFLVQGGEVNVPVGTRASARIAADVDVPLTGLAAPVETAATEAAAEPTSLSNGENQQ